MARKRLQYTLFNTPVISPFLRIVALFLMKVTGWKTDGKLPDLNKFVVIVAPHTSNWDLFYGIIIAFAFKVDVYYMAKHQLFSFPFGHLMKWLGGIRIDRTHAGNTVEQTIEQFKKNEHLIIALGPEGTRSKARGWKSGFYHIALGAGVPIMFAFIDYARKAGGCGPVLHPTGDLDADMQVIRNFFSSITGRYPEKATDITIER
jgi:1-acyl-sn-glycerol-3-phosphate acyltransferase